MAILNLLSKYLPQKLDDQINGVDGLITQNRAIIAEALLDISMHEAMLPRADTEIELVKDIGKTSERLEYQKIIKHRKHEIVLRQAAIDVLLPELERLEAARAEAEARKVAEEETRQKV